MNWIHKYIKWIIALLAVLMFCAVWCIATQEYFLAVLGIAGSVYTMLVLHYLYTVIAKSKRHKAWLIKRAEYEERDKKLASDELFFMYSHMEKI